MQSDRLGCTNGFTKLRSYETQFSSIRGLRTNYGGKWDNFHMNSARDSNKRGQAYIIQGTYTNVYIIIIMYDIPKDV